MPRAAICDTCGARSTQGGRVRRLNELGFGPENERKAIHLCTECLEERQARYWNMTDEAGQRLRDALHQRYRVSGQRYSYLMEPDEAIHLVRLQPDWVDQQASDV